MTSRADLAAMYQDALLAHYRAPRNRRSITEASGSAARANPLCGDEVRIEVRVRGDTVADVAFTGRGCSIAIASASMLTEDVRGLTVRDAQALHQAVQRVLRGEHVPELPTSLDPLRGVAPFPARHGCASMPWLALLEALPPVW